MKYVLITIDDENWDRETLPKIAAALKKIKPRHIQTVILDGKNNIRENVEAEN
jgi:hypothetical protein